MRAPTSLPLGDLHLYRPGARVTLLALLPLVLVLVGVASYASATRKPLPIWLLIAVGVWVLVLPLVLLSLKTVRVSARGIATGRPLRPLREIPWQAIRQVRKGRTRIIIYAATGQRISFMLSLLHDASGLERQLVARLPAHVFSARISANTVPRPGLHSDMAQPRLLSQSALTARPSAGLRATLILLTALLVAGAILAFAALPLVPAIIVAVVASLLALAPAATVWWLMQSVTIDEQGLAMRPFLARREREVRWSDMELVEYTAGERLIRARNGITVRMAGPGLFSRRLREIYLTLLIAYRSERDILAVERSWPDLWGSASTTDTLDTREWHTPFVHGFRRPGTRPATTDDESPSGEAIAPPVLGAAKPTPPLAAETRDLPTLDDAPQANALPSEDDASPSELVSEPQRAMAEPDVATPPSAASEPVADAIPTGTDANTSMADARADAGVADAPAVEG